MRTILIIDQSKDGVVTGQGLPYYINENDEKVTLSKTSVATYMKRNEHTNIIELQAKVAELQMRLRKALTNDRSSI